MRCLHWLYIAVSDAGAGLSGEIGVFGLVLSNLSGMRKISSTSAEEEVEEIDIGEPGSVILVVNVEFIV